MNLKIVFALCLFTFFNLTILYGQTCTGSLGDPIVDISFGAGPNFGPQLPSGATSSLGYQPNICPRDGFYSMVNYTSGCWANDVVWHSATDHTGDANGYYMLVNASFQPSHFYIQNITGLCAGTTYEFAAWFLNMCSVRGIYPNISLTIEKGDGTVLAAYDTGDIPMTNPFTWKKYGFTFTLPAGVSSVILRMRNNAPGGVGNDVGLDDISFRPVGPKVNLSITGFAGSQASVCAGSGTILDLTSTVDACYPNNEYHWQVSTDTGKVWKDIPGAISANLLRSPTAAGYYQYRMLVAQSGNINSPSCRIASEAVTVIAEARPPNITITSSSNNLCSITPITYSATAGIPGAFRILSYQWTKNNVAVGGNSSSFTDNAPSNGDIIQSTVISNEACAVPGVSNKIILTINSPITTAIRKEICEGSSYEGYTGSGTYVDKYNRVNGCDSIRTLTLSVKPRMFTTVINTMCEGEKYEGYTTTGNYTDTFKAANGCDSVRNLKLTVLVKKSTIIDTVICAGNNVEGYAAPGVYINAFRSAEGCDSTRTLRLQVIKLPVPDLGDQRFFCTGDSILLSPGSFSSYSWQDGSGAKTFSVSKPGLYSVRVTNSCGAASDEVYIEERLCTIYFPTAFTPDGDGKNDVFKVLNAYHLTSYHLVVYNRWGEKTFETRDVARAWDGRLNGKVSAGTYAWFSTFTQSGKKYNAKGTVTLIK